MTGKKLKEKTLSLSLMYWHGVARSFTWGLPKGPTARTGLETFCDVLWIGRANWKWFCLRSTQSFLQNNCHCSPVPKFFQRHSAFWGPEVPRTLVQNETLPCLLNITPKKRTFQSRERLPCHMNTIHPREKGPIRPINAPHPASPKP